MYEVKQIYSLEAYTAWLNNRKTKNKSDWDHVRDGDYWQVHNWDELRRAVSFLTLMNKRDVLYFRGQGSHYQQCLPVLFRNQWRLAGIDYPLTANNRAAYYEAIVPLQDEVLKVVKKIGTPRDYILAHVPCAAAAILQHYELWPTQFVDITRSLPIAISFAEANNDNNEAILYVFAMPDLRGSITSDIDQHLTLARLEAICPPDAKRPHHQDAYLVSRFPEPPGKSQPGEKRWDDWQQKTDLMRRLVAKFKLKLSDGIFPGTPALAQGFLIPKDDAFGVCLTDNILPKAIKIASGLNP